tara:strand:+ start:742163 stop:742294 length:132 start_codon:yes stop_codon:yes gene_type:complete
MMGDQAVAGNQHIAMLPTTTPSQGRTSLHLAASFYVVSLQAVF